LLLFPIQYYFLRRAAKQLEFNAKSEANKTEQTESSAIEKENEIY